SQGRQRALLGSPRTLRFDPAGLATRAKPPKPRGRNLGRQPASAPLRARITQGPARIVKTRHVCAKGLRPQPRADARGVVESPASDKLTTRLGCPMPPRGTLGTITTYGGVSADRRRAFRTLRLCGASALTGG